MPTRRIVGTFAAVTDTRARAPAAAWLGFALLAGCVDTVPPPWQIDGPRLLLVELEVVATGPYAAPLSGDPPGLTRRQALPGDTVALRPIIVDPSGPLDLSDRTIWLRGASEYVTITEPVPPCGADGADGLGLCRLAGPEIVLPPAVVVQGFLRVPIVLAIAGEPDGPSAESCLSRLAADPPEPVEDCLISAAPLRYGPAHAVAALMGDDAGLPVTDPDFNLEGATLALELSGAAGDREILAAHGDTITVEADDTIVARPDVDEAQLQEFVIGDPPVVDVEDVQTQWYSNAALFDPGASIDAPFRTFSIPPAVASFDLHLVLSERPGQASTGRWLWVRFVVRGRGGATP